MLFQCGAAHCAHIPWALAHLQGAGDLMHHLMGSVNTCCLAPAEDRCVHCFILFSWCLFLSQPQADFVLEPATEGLANHL